MAGLGINARWGRSCVLCMVPMVFLPGCVSRQSALHPAGKDAADLAQLFWAMAAGGAAIWVIVMGCALYAVLGKRKPRGERFADRFILIGGVVFPTVVLAALLIFGLRLLPDWRDEDAPTLRVHVAALQYWWRFTYETPDRGLVETANEVHLPLGAEVEFVVTSPDMIHSFWIPALGGKMDAIPGRTNVIRLTPTATGTYRGVCAEYCGLSHALMAFVVVIHPPEDFAAWLAAEARPASVDVAPFARAGCIACHTIRGVAELARTGPDLTHLAARPTIAAGTLPMDAPSMRRWLVATDEVKPGVLMPAYGMLPEHEIDALVAALMELR